jgi:hypothetical protein
MAVQAGGSGANSAPALRMMNSSGASGPLMASIVSIARCMSMGLRAPLSAPTSTTVKPAAANASRCLPRVLGPA